MSDIPLFVFGTVSRETFAMLSQVLWARIVVIVCVVVQASIVDRFSCKSTRR